MVLVRVESSNVSEVGYDPEAQALLVVFRSGGRYLYRGVPAEVHAGLLEAESKGAYLARHVVRPGRYRAEKLPPPLPNG